LLKKVHPRLLLYQRLDEISNKIINYILKDYSFVEMGQDFMIDRKGKIYLIEVNSKPGIQGFYLLGNKKVLSKILKNREDE